MIILYTTVGPRPRQTGTKRNEEIKNNAQCFFCENNNNNLVQKNGKETFEIPFQHFSSLS